MSTVNGRGEIIAAVMKMMNQMNRLESRPRLFGTDVPIYRSEIHTITAIGDNPGRNVTELAEILGIAKPSVTEIVQKIEGKGLIERYKLPANRKEVRIRLTRKGVTAYQGHIEYHTDMYTNIYAHMERVPAKALHEFKIALDEINAFLDTEIRNTGERDERRSP